MDNDQTIEFESKSDASETTTIVPQLLPIEKSQYQRLNDVKTNLINIFTNRGFINPENQKKYTDKMISQENDDLEYIIHLDNATNYNTTIEKKRIYLKIFDYKISSINKDSPIGEFLTKYNDEYKFIIVENINQRSEKMIASYKTACEIFKIAELKLNIIDHILVPKHIVLTVDEGKAVREAYNAKKRDMPFMSSTDPIARYYGMKPDEICKIIRPSVMTCEAPFYRIVVKSLGTKAKT
ncbi:MAG: DNA-directed RNA polymerase subunit 5 [Gaeavirus sp.]|uniref:DNA-directed RNA polymerase subunit 5 n=1 Tax=Gaeavirus sp. TaxID=2487767 RepID=A0A3G5A1H7_9VIRU|nr:MAG: DNA-directed RNA polymerase subunit 5 [Gaeavirus sp.]